MNPFDFSDADLPGLKNLSQTYIFDQLQIGIAIFSPQGMLRYTNKAYLEMHGLVSEEVLGRDVRELFPTGEKGVMAVVRTLKPNMNASVTSAGIEAVTYRHPLVDEKNRLLGVMTETLTTNIAKDKLLGLILSLKQHENRLGYSERKDRRHVQGVLYTFDDIVGTSPAMQRMKQLGRKFAANNAPVLISGESGTGKELVAQALHSAGRRAGKPFLVVNCAAIPQELLESELFGYEAGAFTGARQGGRKGKFELADSGTIFLDEIGELPLPMQAKLLRVLESGEIQKIAYSKSLYSDFRLITATNRNLARMVEEGKFRSDLFHRLNVFDLHLPPLRERKEDLPLLTEYFIEQILGIEDAVRIRVVDAVYRLFFKYAWPGNVRELKNILTYALYAREENGGILSVAQLPEHFLQAVEDRPGLSGRLTPQGRESGARQRPGEQRPTDRHQADHHQIEQPPAEQFLDEVSADAEREAIIAALERAAYNKSVVARDLGISRNKLYRKLHALGLVKGRSSDRQG